MVIKRTCSECEKHECTLNCIEKPGNRCNGHCYLYGRRTCYESGTKCEDFELAKDFVFK